MIARIYAPSKTAMQSGKARTEFWVLQYEPEKAKRIEHSMSDDASVLDVNAQVSMRFSTKEEAVAFARKYAIPYRVENFCKAKYCRVSYSDNFRVDRKQPWTH